MQHQIWYCEECKQVGILMNTAHRLDIFGVVGDIGREHRNCSPDCSKGTYELFAVTGPIRLDLLPEWSRNKVKELIQEHMPELL